MNKEDLKEFIRRLEAEDFTFQPSANSLGTVDADNGMSVSIESDGAILYKPGNRLLALRVMELYNQVQEYMPVYRNAPLDTVKHLDWLDNTRTLLIYNNCELAANRFSDGHMQFVTWRLDRNGARDNGYYYNDYKDAKQNFAIRAELINQDMLFSEKELTVIRSHLSDYLASENTFMSGSQEDAVKEVISKIDNIIAPEIRENAEEAYELGYEPEQSL